MGQLVFKDTQRSSPWNAAIYISPPAAEVFIETGTCAGETLSNAVDVETFKECHSVECYQPAYLKMVKHFLHVPKAKIYLGSSPDILPYLIDPKRATLFWLDAHYVPDFGQYQEHGEPVLDLYGQCPLLAELDVIMALQWEAPAYILIDDAHLFGQEFWDAASDQGVQPDGTILEDIVKIGDASFLRKGLKRDQWPTMEQIKAKLPKHRVEVISNAIMGVPIG